jgi:hypothetical protein
MPEKRHDDLGTQVIKYKNAIAPVAGAVLHDRDPFKEMEQCPSAGKMTHIRTHAIQ